MKDADRRSFLMASVGAALWRADSARGAGETIGTGMIGTGNRGTHMMRSVLEQPGVKVTAVCDIKPDRLDNAATVAARDKPATFTDYRRLLEQKDVDAVFISTPCDLHVEMSIAALEAGKHVYCEKPVGITPESIGELVKAAKAAKTVFQAGQQRRSEARLAKTIEKIHQRAAGFGGTLLWVDDPPGRTNMDGYILSYEYANGVKMSFTQVFFHARGMPGGGQYTYVYGTEGSVDLDTSTLYPREKGAKPVVLAEPQEENRQAHVTAFFESIRTGKKPPADITVGATGALTAIMGREAIYHKKVMTWRELGVEL